MADVDVAGVLRALKGFQRDAVDHLIAQFYPDGEKPASPRFLIADETGLGKSIVARGAIARAIDKLETDPNVERIDIVYICSNQDLAQQNLRRLNVTGERELPLATRLTLLATVLPRLSAPSTDGGKKVNLISFTPATSGMTGGGWRTGKWEERALLSILLRPLIAAGASEWDALIDLMKATKGVERFREGVNDLAQRMGGTVDPAIQGAFEALIREGATTDDDSTSMLGRMRALVQERASGQNVHWERVASLVGRLRQALAKASVNALEPDLVILDEFQKFRELLADPDTSEAAELAHAMFTHEDARVLLLSATPYSPFTRADDADDDHYKEFLDTVRFLAGWQEEPVRRIRDALEAYRSALILGGDAHAAAGDVRQALLPYMTRSERPQLTHGFVVSGLPVDVPAPADIVDFVHLRTFGEEIGAPIDIEYWKSIPYFANFMEGYKPGVKARATFATPEGHRAEGILAATRSMNPDDLEAFAAVEPANGYLAALKTQTVDAGWWRMLWMPPSMPYLEPGEIYSAIGDVTKRLVFSAWSGVPTSVASLLSYEADRKVAEASGGFLAENTSAARLKVAERFTYRTKAGEVGALSTLALFWPHPSLAQTGDPLTASREAGRRLSIVDAENHVARALPTHAADNAWDAFFSVEGLRPSLTDARSLVRAALGDEASEDTSSEVPDSGVLRHVEEAMRRFEASPDEAGHPDLVRLAMHAPGNIAYRALQRVAGTSVTPDGIWVAAFALADGLRRLFDRTESVATLVGIYGDDRVEHPYWSSVLSYCADGNLQAVLDEYLFQLRSDLGGIEVGDAELLHIARHASEVLRLRPARYLGHDTTRDRAPIPFHARFALRYGARFGDNADIRDGAVRAAFNSPFAPFVLISTSVGQEGIDFHWWCHAVVHWNLPRNPVDFEQREGRVNRFAGHAIRRNVAEAHWDDVLAGEGDDPWSAAFDAASQSEAVEQFGEFAPWWVYPGPAQVERILARYPLSRDQDRYERLRDDLALYRLTLGQPRQEDMLSGTPRCGVDDGLRLGSWESRVVVGRVITRWQRGSGGCMARVQRVAAAEAVTWTVVDDVGAVVGPAESFLEFARGAGYSPNTIRGYAKSLSLWWTHLEGGRRGWDSVTAADLARFMSAVRSGQVGVPSIGVRVPARAEATVNVRVRAVLSMYRYHAQLGTQVLPSSSAWGAEPTGSFVPFLGHLSRRHAVRAQAPVVLRASPRELPVLDPVVIDRLLDAEARFDPARGSWVGDLRYRLLWLLLWQSGMRIGEALGLRHRDWVVARGSTAKVLIRPSAHPHGYRPKSGPRDVHVGAALDGLYGDYVWWLCERGADREIANWDDSFIFCNVKRRPLYAPLRVESVYAHLGVMKKRIAVLPAAATPHWFRHTHATAMLMSGARIEVVSRRLGHRSIQTTIDHYGHVTDDAELAAFANWEAVTRGWETNR